MVIGLDRCRQNHRAIYLQSPQTRAETEMTSNSLSLSLSLSLSSGDTPTTTQIDEKVQRRH